MKSGKKNVARSGQCLCRIAYIFFAVEYCEMNIVYVHVIVLLYHCEVLKKYNERNCRGGIFSCYFVIGGKLDLKTIIL